MSELQIAWLELITVGGLGAILVLSGVLINVIAKRKSRLCTKRTEGIVVRHGFLGNGNMYPVVEYLVDGTRYKTKKKFRGVVTTKISGFPVHAPSKVYEDEKGWLHVQIGSVANLRQSAEQLWPVGSRMTVYYNPDNPKNSYADRPVFNGITSIIFILMGLLIIILSVLLFFLMKL